MSERKIIHRVSSHASSDGEGVKIQRNNLMQQHVHFDPFLLLDELGSDEASEYIGGFPTHPHRGFETITYMLEGVVEHQDHMGNVGTLNAGGVQWMRAGSGVLHSEMPKQQEGRLHGFQVWLNLPSKEKMSAPSWQDYSGEELPEVNFGKNSRLKIISGAYQQGEKLVESPIKQGSTEVEYFDVNLVGGDQLSMPVSSQKTALLYVYEGELQVGEESVSAQEIAVLGNGDQVSIKGNGRALLLIGKPIREPVANYGPFVMNTRREINQAVEDYRNGTLIQ